MVLKIAFSVLLFCGLAFASGDTYEGYKIYDIHTKNALEKEVVVNLSKNIGYDFFLLTKQLEEAARVMIQPQDQNDFETILNIHNIKFTVVDENVGRTVERQNYMISFFDTAGSRSIFSQFQRHNEINDYLDSLAISYPERVAVEKIGESYEGRDMKLITISNGDDAIRTKKVIFIDAGIHAREWIAPATALYVIHQLVENFHDNKHLLNDYDWAILPVVNPDGYEYTHTNARLWRKTRKPASKRCLGTDGNRNFDYRWGVSGSSQRPCSNTFRGSKVFSEPETQVVRNLMHSLTGRAKMYLSLHSYGNYFLYPWGYTTNLPSNWKDLDEVAQAGAAAISSFNGTKYKVGSTSNVLYAAAGGSADYALAVAKIPISITMELPSGGNGFRPSAKKIEPFAAESWIGIEAMAEKVISKY